MKKDPINSLTSDSIAAQFKTLKELNASTTSIIYRDKNDQPLAAVIFVSGTPETKQILEAVKTVEDAWQHEDQRTH